MTNVHRLGSRNRGSFWKGVLVVVCAWALLLGGSCLRMLSRDREEREEQTRANVAVIQAVLERYSVENRGLYPADLQTLITEGYLDALPENPYTGKPMRGVLLEQRDPGGVVYWVTPDRTGYCVGAFGQKKSPGIKGTGLITISYGGLTPGDPTVPQFCRTSGR